nr:NosD domain-containing protein [Anaerobacillus isosaccharinicus]QOY36575.1 right-handed parallel beta-helix repeat-containing protein [Anaerobacillus isosaccharinicus]
MILTSDTYSFASEKGIIQALIDEAKPGEEITIQAGIYEEVISITKPIKINGEGVMLINTSDDIAIHIKSDHVSLSGLTVVQLTSHPESPAILIEGNDNHLSQLTINSLGTSIQLFSANRNLLEHLHIERQNPINFGEANMGSRQGNGFDLFASHENVLKNNTMINLLDGVYIESSRGNIIENNHAIRSRYGYHLMFAEDILLNNNSASLNITGAMIMGSSRVTISNNHFTKQSYHVHSQGLLLYDVHDSVVRGNDFSENLIGLYIERSSKNDVHENKIFANFVGIQLKRVGTHKISHNDFFTNVIQARVTDSEGNHVAENYWDTHTGLDFTGDGKSELTFQADPIFLGLVERKPPYQLLAQSPGLLFVQLLFEMNEEAILKDISPLMEPFSQQITSNKTSTLYDVFLYLSLMVLSIIIIRGGIRK